MQMMLQVSQTLNPNTDSHFFNHKETHMVMRKKYGPLKFIFDAALVVVTGGFWLIWIFVREMRGR